MLDYLNEPETAQLVEKAVIRSIRDNEARTHDLGGTATTSEFADHVAKLVRG